MMEKLLYLALGTLFGIVLKTYALPLVLMLAKLRNLVLAALSPEGKALGEEMLADLYDEISEYRKDGDSSDSIALKVFLRLVGSFPGDVAYCVSLVSFLIANRAASWSVAVRHYRPTRNVIATAGTLLAMNAALLSSQSGRSPAHWLPVNGIGIAASLLMCNVHRPVARRVLYLWFGLSFATAMGFMAWLSISRGMYGDPTFVASLLGVAAVAPGIVVSDKRLRGRLFGNRWWAAAGGWALFAAATALGSWLAAGSILPWAEVLLSMAMLAIGLGLVAIVFSLAAGALCWAGVRGGAGGLRLVAAGIRRLR